LSTVEPLESAPAAGLAFDYGSCEADHRLYEVLVSVNQHGRSRIALVPRLLPWILAGVLLAATGMAFWAARLFYLQRSELRLAPVNMDRYLRENAALGPKLRRRVVFFGDSRISQWSPLPAAGGSELLWRGVDGETTAQMTFRFGQDVTQIQADAVVIQAGINDLVAGVALGRGERAVDAALRNIGTMIAEARSASIEVYLLTVIRPAAPPPWRRPVWSGSMTDEVIRLNSGLTGMSGPGVRLLDADNALAGGARDLPRRFAVDTLHLNAEGYSRLNELVARAIMDEGDAVQ
jgi:lysophospholipase L1-like esterase